MPNIAPRLTLYHRLMRELAVETERLEGVPEEMRAVHDEFTEAQAAIEQLRRGAEEAGHERRTREAAVADAQEKLRKYQQQVSLVRNQREYGALLSEIDGAKTALRTLEEGALEAIDRAERLTRELQERRSGIGDLESRYQAALADWETKKPAVAARVRDLKADVEQARKQLPPGMPAQYDRIAARYRGDVLTTVRRAERPNGAVLWHCATCNYKTRSQLAVEILTRGAVVQCDGCKRFLLAEQTPA
jgi:predicted  nucleic acid-binding Zn-ribbon protein